MKYLILNSIGLAAALAATSPALAADGNETGTRSDELPIRNAQPSWTTPHFHPEEKLGIRMPQKAAERDANHSADSAKRVWPDRERHLHPRDAK